MNDQARGREHERAAFERRWRSRFSRFALDHEDDAGIAGWTPTGLAARVRQFARAWQGDRHGALWLDAGCGAGTYVRLLQSRGLAVLGLDYSPVSVEKARRRGAGAAWVVGDANALPVPSGRFDGALCFGVTQALASSRDVVEELARAVRPGGQIWIDGLNGWCLPHALERLLRRLRGQSAHVRYESPFRLRALLRERGLEDVRLIWLPILPARLQHWQGAVESAPVHWLLHRLPPVGALFSHSMLVSGRVAKALP